ncbi:MAG: hypothetical protein ACJAVR_001655 [Paracoccaceae bacterium]|jgi:hypothetical protein
MITTAARLAARRAGADDAALPHDLQSGPIAEAERIDEEFFGRSSGNLADYAIRNGLMHQAAARKLRSIASISARDPRCICALGGEGAKSGLKQATSSQILASFRVAMSALLARGPKAIPDAGRARAETARKLAMSTAATVKQIALISDALAQHLYAYGDPKAAYAFAMISCQAVNRTVSARARISAQLSKVALR